MVFLLVIVTKIMMLNSRVIPNYISLALMSLLTLMSVINNQISVFYIIYLFWFDELIKCISYFFHFYSNKTKISNPTVFLKSAKSRLFLLGVYVVFIVVFFGLLSDWNNPDLIIFNLSTLFFKNLLFNITIGTFIVRELFLFFNSDKIYSVGSVFLSNGIIILHISIVIGAFIWGFLPKEMVDFTTDNVRSGIIIAPFLLLKLFFELKA